MGRTHLPLGFGNTDSLALECFAYAVQNAVDKPEGIIGAIFFGDAYGFVDYDGSGYIVLIHKGIGTHP
jgi:hypothetical protein